MSLTIGWLAQGKMRVKTGDELPRTIESRFGKDVRDRGVKAQQRHAWKAQGEGEKFLAGAILWGRAFSDPAAVRVSITSFCRGASPGQAMYSLETDDMCAILGLDNLGEEERRLWHKNDKRLDSLAVSPEGALACSVRHKFGTANIAVRLDEESGFSEVTEGDSLDTSPRWVPGETRRLVFQSAGVGRNSQGHFAGLGPYSIQMLDIDGGELTTLAEDGGHDLLTPQMTADGTLYYIRRPYVTGRVHPLRLAKDILLFPFRLLYALFHYLQFFSMRYTGKKLTSADGARGREMDLKQMMIWGNVVAARNARADDEAADLVPNTWQLIRKPPAGAEEVIAKSVLAFDLAPDGSVVYSNGSAIHVVGPDGKRQRIVTESLIERVVVL